MGCSHATGSPEYSRGPVEMFLDGGIDPQKLRQVHSCVRYGPEDMGPAGCVPPDPMLLRKGLQVVFLVAVKLGPIKA
jgi:hypothetical protein